jgi:thiosulfate/3-mercaptopyruvate sulfurtransferase
MFRYALFAAALTAAGAVQAAPRDQLLVTPAWLAAHAGDANLVILHAGDKAEYDAKHIPGAVRASGGDIAPSADGLMAQLPAPEELRKRLQALGISDRSRIVVYTGRDLPYATRVLFTLDAAGLGKQASLLDGGLAGWERAGHATTAEARPVKPGVLSPLKTKPAIVDAAFIQTKVKGPRYDLIDARAPVFYDGLQPGFGTNPPAKGRLPNARNIPFNTLTDATGQLKPASELQTLFKTAGVAPGDKIAVYCHIGYQATAVIYAARTLGIDAVLYDGSFQDWAGRGLPLDVTAATK